MIIDWPTKDPDDFLDYYVDWSDELDGASILTSIFFIASPVEEEPSLILSDEGIIGGMTKVWIEGGLPDINYFVTNRIEIAGETVRIKDRSIRLRVRVL